MRKHTHNCWACGCQVRVLRKDLDGHTYCHKHYRLVGKVEQEAVAEAQRKLLEKFSRLFEELGE